MMPNATNLTQRNTSSDILDGVTLNITEMNIAGSIPLAELKNKSENATNAWFNWTTSAIDEPLVNSTDAEDKQTNVTLPPPKKLNATKNANSTSNSTKAAGKDPKTGSSMA